MIIGSNLVQTYLILRFCLSIIQYLNQGSCRQVPNNVQHQVKSLYQRYNLSFNNDWTTVLCCVEQVGHQKCQASIPVLRIFPGFTAYMGWG